MYMYHLNVFIAVPTGKLNYIYMFTGTVIHVHVHVYVSSQCVYCCAYW